jgi:sulfur transfer protein SufE
MNENILQIGKKVAQIAEGVETENRPVNGCQNVSFHYSIIRLEHKRMSNHFYRETGKGTGR